MPVIHISNGTIEEITSERGMTLVTVKYQRGSGSRTRTETVRLVVTPRTILLHTNGIPVPVGILREGMVVNAAFSSAMTRSIPPQASAYVIQIVQNPNVSDRITIGEIQDIDRRNRSFTTIRGRDTSSIIRFHLAEDAVLLNRQGRPVHFSRFTPGTRVRVRHANFMTASIPPQTTAFEVQMIGL